MSHCDCVVLVCEVRALLFLFLSLARCVQATSLEQQSTTSEFSRTAINNNIRYEVKSSLRVLQRLLPSVLHHIYTSLRIIVISSHTPLLDVVRLC